MSELNDLAKAIQANTAAVRLLLAKSSQPVVEPIDEKERLREWIGELNKSTAAIAEATKNDLIELPVAPDK